MSEWRVYLNGSKPSLDFLAKEHDAEWSVCHDVERVYLTRSSWKKPTDGAEVLAFAERLCDRINLGMSFLTAITAPHWEPISIAAVRFVNDLGEVVLHHIWADLVSPIGWTAEKATPSEEPPPIRLLVRALEESPDLVEAIRLLTQHGDNWTQICKVIELAEIAQGGRIPSDWVSEKKIALLNRTAQFAETAGESARHRGLPAKPPPHPMRLPEAQAIVRLIILRWLNSATC